MRHRTWIVAVALLLCGVPAFAQQSELLSLDSLLNTKIRAASKYLQTSAEAPASVTIITAEDIRAHRYRNLREVLETVRGYYVSHDRNYPYLGIRGFSRPTDYNDRLLVLVDGHALNDQVWGGAPVGSDLPINLSAVERIEVIRGPGSAIYGTNAMFGVINIVTKTGTQLDGVRVAGRYGTGASREAMVAAGFPIGTRASVAASGIVTRSDGETLRFPELSDDNGGIARNLDWEESVGALASGSFRSLSTNAGYRKRSKGIPTGAYDSSLGDPRAQTTDETLWGDVTLRRQISPAIGVSMQLYGDRYQYMGVYPAGPGTPYSDGGGSTAYGGELLATWDPISRDRLTVGFEYRDVVRADYFEHEASGVETRDDSPFRLASVFAENSLHLTPVIDVIAGVRYEHQTNEESQVAPRFAVLLTPSARTTVKLLYGEAYRTPSEAEADLSTATYEPNPDLRAERIATAEIEVRQHVSKPLLLTASAFRYQIRDLIDLVSIDGLRQQFLNLAKARAAGIEFQADWMPSGPFAAHATYSAQRTRGDDGHQPLTNAPAHIASVAVTAASAGGFNAAATVRYESGRRTLQGASTDAFVRTDLNAGYAFGSNNGPGWARGIGASIRVTNLFDTRYEVPGGLEHRQAALPQPGRVVTLRIDWSR